MLNIIANKLRMQGYEYATNNKFGIVPYFTKFIDERKYTLPLSARRTGGVFITGEPDDTGGKSK